MVKIRLKNVDIMLAVIAVCLILGIAYGIYQQNLSKKNNEIQYMEDIHGITIQIMQDALHSSSLLTYDDLIYHVETGPVISERFSSSSKAILDKDIDTEPFNKYEEIFLD